MLTAAEARALMPPPPMKIERSLEVISNHIAELAGRGLGEVRLSRFYYNKSDFSDAERASLEAYDQMVGAGIKFKWDNLTQVQQDYVHGVIQALDEAGYKIKTFYEERQFVDAGCLIVWGES